jgi:hypothetical protein
LRASTLFKEANAAATMLLFLTFIEFSGFDSDILVSCVGFSGGEITVDDASAEGSGTLAGGSEHGEG